MPQLMPQLHVAAPCSSMQLRAAPCRSLLDAAFNACSVQLHADRCSMQHRSMQPRRWHPGISGQAPSRGPQGPCATKPLSQAQGRAAEEDEEDEEDEEEEEDASSNMGRTRARCREECISM